MSNDSNQNETEKQLEAIFKQTSQALNNQVVLGKQIKIIQEQLNVLLKHNGLIKETSETTAA